MSAILEQLDNVLEQYENYLQAGVEVAEKPKFEVTDKSSAEWVLRKISQIKAEADEIIKIAHEQIDSLQTEIDKVSAWETEELRKLNNHTEFMKSLLEPYHKKIIEADPKAKTIKLPHGELKIRKQQPEIIKHDTLLLTWLETNKMDSFIKVEKKPQWAELKKECEILPSGGVVHKGTGEVVLGVTTQERPDKFEVTVK